MSFFRNQRGTAARMSAADAVSSARGFGQPAPAPEAARPASATDRVSAILGHPEAVGREAQARHLAYATARPPGRHCPRCGGREGGRGVPGLLRRSGRSGPGRGLRRGRVSGRRRGCTPLARPLGPPSRPASGRAIDENLCRANLSAAQLAAQTARPKELYEFLPPETRPTYEGGGGRNNATRRQLGDELADRFTADTAARTGRSERTVQRNAKRGKILGEDLNSISGTLLDDGAKLDARQGKARTDATSPPIRRGNPSGQPGHHGAGWLTPG